MTEHKPAGLAPAPPPRWQLAVMIWLAVFPTLTVLQVLLGGVLGTLPVVLRTLVLSSLAVPIVVYLVLPRLQRARAMMVDRS
jgi:antibiotic biosynthesis monooxygenase (ABM) superfamily enzyme